LFFFLKATKINENTVKNKQSSENKNFSEGNCPELKCFILKQKKEAAISKIIQIILSKLPTCFFFVSDKNKHNKEKNFSLPNP